MSYSIDMTPTAKDDLRDIFRYIAYDLQALTNAVGQIERLEKAIMSLDSMPERYRVYDKPKWRERNLRVMPVDNYLVFYVPEQEKHTVTIVRIMYGGRDIDRQLNTIE